MILTRRAGKLKNETDFKGIMKNWNEEMLQGTTEKLESSLRSKKITQLL